MLIHHHTLTLQLTLTLALGTRRRHGNRLSLLLAHTHTLTLALGIRRRHGHRLNILLTHHNMPTRTFTFGICRRHGHRLSGLPTHYHTFTLVFTSTFTLTPTYTLHIGIHVHSQTTFVAVGIRGRLSLLLAIHTNLKLTFALVFGILLLTRSLLLPFSFTLTSPAVLCSPKRLSSSPEFVGALAIG